MHGIKYFLKKNSFAFRIRNFLSVLYDRARSDVAAFAQPFAVFASTMILVDPSYTGVIPGDQVSALHRVSHSLQLGSM